MSFSIVGVIAAVAIVGCTGCLMGFFLCFASEKFKVEVDEREDAILEVLPGNNCGGCGYAGCSGLAAAIVKGEAPVNGCPVGGAPVGAKIGEIMGVEAEESVRKVAFVKCAGTCEKAKKDYEYAGVEDCRAMAYVPGGGPKACSYGCMGYGSCVAACPCDAIHSEDKGPKVMKVCEVGCIGCKLCEKQCQFDAIHVLDNVAHIDQEKCTGCGACAAKCPKKIITMVG